MKARTALVAAILVVVVASAVFAQRGRPGRGGRGLYSGRPARYATMDDFKGGFQFCRIVFRQGNGDGAGWNVDWPRADINLSIRLSELTSTRVGRDASFTPKHLLVELSDPELFHCPFVMMTNVGAIAMSAREVANLRDYLLKGGFVWADDFWGSASWDWWEAQLRRVLPAPDFPLIDLPAEHPLFHAQFTVKGTPQIANIGFWTRSGGGTSERGTDSAVVHTRAIVDSHGRIMVLSTHNTDLGDSFEREGDDPSYFMVMSVPGYAFGINTLLYAMTH